MLELYFKAEVFRPVDWRNYAAEINSAGKRALSIFLIILDHWSRLTAQGLNNHKQSTDLNYNTVLKSKSRAMQNTCIVHNFEIYLVMAAGQIKFVFNISYVGVLR